MLDDGGVTSTMNALSATQTATVLANGSPSVALFTDGSNPFSNAITTNGATNEIAWELIRLACSSKAGLSIVPLQDMLNLGGEGRMNLPGTAEGNWRWRWTERMLKDSAFERLRDLTLVSGRTASLRNAIQNETVQAAYEQ